MKIKYAVHHYVDGCYEGVRGIFDKVEEAIERHKQLSETEATSDFDFTIEVVYDGGGDEDKVFAAVHVITESCDHYNYLLEVQDCSDLIEQLISSLGDEFAHICDVYVTMPEDFDTNAVEASIMCRSAKYLEGGDD
ncbi:hypothetical protein ACT414_18880 (plasmid) [Acinetobacter baumannii]